MKNKNNFAKQTMPYILLFMVIMQQEKAISDLHFSTLLGS